MQTFFRGISFRLALVSVILAFFLGLLMTSIQFYVDYHNEKEKLEKRIDQLIEQAKPTVSRAVLMLDGQLANEVINGILTYSFITHVGIEDENGALIREGSRPASIQESSWASSFIPTKTQEYKTSFPIPGYRDEISATLFFTVDETVALADYVQRSQIAFTISVLRSLILAILLFIAFHLMLTQPLIRLSKEFQSIDLEKPDSRRLTELPSNRRDELTILTASGNQLLNAVDLALAKHRTVESALRNSEEHIRQVIDSLPVFVGARDKLGRYIFANEVLADFMGRTVDEMTNTHLSEYARFFKTSVEEMLKVDQQVIAQQHKVEQMAEIMVTGDGHTMYFQTHHVPIIFDGEPAVLSVSVDITSQKRAQDRMEYMAFHDALTKLPNRIQLVERLEHEISRARRHSFYGAVLFVDLDQFKNINDSLGHPVGDEVLKQVATRLKRCIRDEDFVARLSGDEFVIALTVLDRNRSTAALKAGEIGEKVREAIAEPYLYNGMELRVTCSIGVAVYPDENSDVHELLRFADTAMYQGKERGRDVIEFFNADMADKVTRQLAMEGDLHKALDEKQFALFFQPKVDVKTGEMIGAEALLRWFHPDGLISPAEFIPVLETSGLILDVGDWILDEACCCIKEWTDKGLWKANMKLGVNVSPRQFRQKNFVQSVFDHLDRSMVPVGTLEIEITESIVIQNIEETISTMNKLVNKGVSFSLDDFGTGYSSISYLKQLPVSAVKIDQAFIRDILIDRNDKVLVETMITMGRLLGLDVVAEGVEQAEQLELLDTYGCQSYQGYFYSRPVPKKEFEALLNGEIVAT